MLEYQELSIITQNFYAFKRFCESVVGGEISDIHEFLYEVMEESGKDIVDHGFFLRDTDLNIINKAVVNGLRSILNDYGDLKKQFIGSAAKRIVGELMALKAMENANGDRKVNT
jgi:hypothetical protein